MDVLLSITTCSSNSWLGGQGSIVWTVEEGQCNTIMLSSMKSQIPFVKLAVGPKLGAEVSHSLLMFTA